VKSITKSCKKIHILGGINKLYIKKKICQKTLTILLYTSEVSKTKLHHLSNHMNELIKEVYLLES